MRTPMIGLLFVMITVALPAPADEGGIAIDLEGVPRTLGSAPGSGETIVQGPGPLHATFGEPSIGVFEDWREPTMRSDRWYATTSRAHEVRREVQGQQLVMRLRLEGFTDHGDTGLAGASHRMFAANASGIDRLEADFRIRSSTLRGCLENQIVANTRVRPAGISLTLFNDGSSSGPQDATGDYFARVLVNREAFSVDPPGVFTVQAFLFRCVNAACTTALSSIFDFDLGQVRTAIPFTLRLAWDAPAARVLFGLDDQPDTILLYDPLLDAGDPAVPFADLITQSVCANCTAGPTVSDSAVMVRQVRTSLSAIVP